ncbi:SDR family oxidoreductase [Nocardioides sp. SLBN-35]|uniref:SDR family oxidoreductase n=1 Tax=Nocardioides sp. SLBN-35 TaxID=2768445 RepID=UPI001150C0F8|nr:SDR family oxidoreductase [Nocardioides sp. SLBN-35]TQK71011.1 NAD(P)-dependent dehydrogenase (short-subunit alcohol dehydrogenase family) [Nocardioides sp. SLBN-35]
MTHVALVTGGSRGLGRALADGLVAAGWHVITDGRDADALATAARPWAGSATAIPGDLTDAAHRDRLVAAVRSRGRLDLLVHNAGVLGPASGTTRRRALAEVGPEDLQHVWRHNVGAPIVVTGLLVGELAASRGTLLSISSDAALEHYEGWGLYGASKAALDHLTMTFAAENPEIRAYAVDPGDMRTRMHQEWFPGEDISDRPLPETVVPHLLALLEQRPPSGRYRAADITVPVAAGG